LECRDTVRLSSLLLLLSSRFSLKACMTNLNLSRDREFPNRSKANFFNDLQRAVVHLERALDWQSRNKWLT
jgi:hypothetical protein